MLAASAPILRTPGSSALAPSTDQALWTLDSEGFLGLLRLSHPQRCVRYQIIVVALARTSTLAGDVTGSAAPSFTTSLARKWSSLGS